MIWPFKHFKAPQAPARGTIEGIYGMIVAQAREPAFYQELGVANTVNGRFEMIVLHLWLVLRGLRAQPGNAALSQALFDHFCGDLDNNLREMGVGDLTVPKRMQSYGEAFYGRSMAYDRAIDGGGAMLAQALQKNVYAGSEAVNAVALADYILRAEAALRAGRSIVDGVAFPPVGAAIASH